jgi:predicted DNA-binding transcriptional regulator AlpA
MDQSGTQISEAILERVRTFTQLPTEALVNVDVVSALAHRSKPSIWRDVNEGRLASPIKIGPNSTRWRAGDVRRYLNGGE